jgi:hypothetical protein
MKVTNTYLHREDGITELSITKRDGSIHLCLIDTADFAEVSKHTWTVSPLGYASRFYTKDGKGITVLMHRHLIGNTAEKMVTDHINGNRMDNRRNNLRVVTQAENMFNRKGSKTAGIPIKGVCYQALPHGGRIIRACVRKGADERLRTWSIREHGEQQAIALAQAWVTKTRTELHGEYARH